MALLEFSPDKILDVLKRHHVELVVIGGLAALAHGSNLPTVDVDITPAQDVSNLARLSDALSELDAQVRFGVDHDAEPLRRRVSGSCTRRTASSASPWCRTAHRATPTWVRDAEATPILGVVVPVASLADVIRSKQAANRPKDQRVLPVLRDILAARSPKR
jgi:hypothetical protein